MDMGWRVAQAQSAMILNRRLHNDKINARLCEAENLLLH
jgi:hypothetical protein